MDGASAASNQASAETSAAPCAAVPAAPTGLTATASSSSAISLSWTAVTPPANCTVSSYSVYRSTTSGFTPSSSTLIASVTTGTTYSNSGLTASTTYYYMVEAVDAEGNSAASAQKSATTQAAASGTEVVAIDAGGPAESNRAAATIPLLPTKTSAAAGTTGHLGHHQSHPARRECSAYGSLSIGTAGIFTYTIPGLSVGASIPSCCILQRPIFLRLAAVCSMWPSMEQRCLATSTSMSRPEPTQRWWSSLPQPPTAVGIL